MTFIFVRLWGENNPQSKNATLILDFDIFQRALMDNQNGIGSYLRGKDKFFFFFPLLISFTCGWQWFSDSHHFLKRSYPNTSEQHKRERHILMCWGRLFWQMSVPGSCWLRPVVNFPRLHACYSLCHSVRRNWTCPTQFHFHFSTTLQVSLAAKSHILITKINERKEDIHSCQVMSRHIWYVFHFTVADSKDVMYS